MNGNKVWGKPNSFRFCFSEASRTSKKKSRRWAPASVCSSGPPRLGLYKVQSKAEGMGRRLVMEFFKCRRSPTRGQARQCRDHTSHMLKFPII